MELKGGNQLERFWEKWALSLLGPQPEKPYSQMEQYRYCSTPLGLVYCHLFSEVFLTHPRKIFLKGNKPSVPISLPCIIILLNIKYNLTRTFASLWHFFVRLFPVEYNFNQGRDFVCFLQCFTRTMTGTRKCSVDHCCWSWGKKPCCLRMISRARAQFRKRCGSLCFFS